MFSDSCCTFCSARFFFLLILLLVFISVLEISIYLPSCSLILIPGPVTSTDESIKGILYFSCCGFEFQHSFDSSLECPSLCFHYPSLLHVSTFPIWDLNILIIVILHSLSDNFNICVVSEYCFDNCFVSSDYICLAFCVAL